MRLMTFVAFLTGLFCSQFCLCDTTAAQELRKTLADFRSDTSTMYQPGDPWQRSKLQNVQTGHYGKFYNCDCEESKRNSPYICWKPDHENNLPPRVGHWARMKCDLAEVRQRLLDGSCGQAGSQCSDCLNAQSAGWQSCARCAAASANQPNHADMTVQSQPTRSADDGKFGLVQGKIIEPRSPVRLDSQAPAPTSIANKSLADHLRMTKRR